MYKSGIYLIISTSHPDRQYVGSSCYLPNRLKHHLSDLQAQKHANAKLQNHYNKYGQTDLYFKIIKFCDKAELLTVEQMFIDYMHPYFNICQQANSRAGIKSSLETRKRLRVNSRFRRKTFWNYRPG